MLLPQTGLAAISPRTDFLDNIAAISMERLRDQLEWMDHTHPAGATANSLAARFTMQSLSSSAWYFPAAPTHTPYVPQFMQPQPTATPVALSHAATPTTRPLHT